MRLLRYFTYKIIGIYYEYISNCARKDINMKKRILLSIITAIMLLNGCSFNNSASSEESSIEASSTAISATENINEDYYSSDYSSQIKVEIDNAVADSLSDELRNINEIYNKYYEIEQNATDQAEMNEFSQWGVLVWKYESTSILERIKENDPANYDSILSEYENWEKYVPSMVEKMSDLYKNGSIYTTIYSYNEAMRYKQRAYNLANTLADITEDTTFTLPDSSMCGYYGDYTTNSYLIITEGMENNSYSVVVHIDDSKELRGYATLCEYPGDKEVLLFTSEDESVKGTIDYFEPDATFYVSETDGSVVGPEEAYTFRFKY